MAYEFAHGGAVYGSGFRLGLSQSMGTPFGAYPADVAVDFAEVTTSAVPEAPGLALIAIGVSGFFIRGATAQRLSIGS